MYYSCWRLRWCGLLLLISVTMQAVAVGGTLSGGTQCSSFHSLISTCVLATTVLALWALLSQLLLWSDAAVLRVPQGVTLSAEASKGGGDKGKELV